MESKATMEGKFKKKMKVKIFIQENGGDIWVDFSEPSKGTKVCFKVPV